MNVIAFDLLLSITLGMFAGASGIYLARGAARIVKDRYEARCKRPRFENNEHIWS
jgi:H+/Cl- antiporter ClcA